ncbi:motility protein A [Spirochaeta africana]|uniref:Flagellar motor component n=1 Tax=Spirochaeta africana (strain ATCC 700263 / DSM 8902 / Z-7692) TaxID=889378 RepID=H9UKV0_SPIAZ|nr:motility protein A [Spirochaeta africana]AFG38143.1 flagellar motor component [Spirochaeta africana DSM 8902]
MDLGTVIGVALGFFMVFLGILFGGAGVGLYVDPNSVLIVLGGSFGAMLVASPLSRVLGLTAYLRQAFFVTDWKEEKMISDLVAFSERARREGLLALEDNLDEVEDEFMRKGVQLVVDGTDPEVIKDILFTDLNQIQNRHESGIQFFAIWGAIAPAFGMIGTLIGLIAMLVNIGGDTTIIGQGMSTALITTLYGSFFANLFLIPVQRKLEDRDKIETRAREITIEGILSIQSGDNPRILLEKLVSFLPPKQREAIRQESVRD